MNKRIFISIALPENIRRKLVGGQEEISRSFGDFCPIKWTRPGNLHITLFFVGYVELEELPEIFKTIEEAAARHEPFAIEIEGISYGPSGKAPKMVWANGKKSPELAALQSDLNDKLAQLSMSDNKFTPHITLGRIVQWQFNRIEPEERPDINISLPLSFSVESIDVMESNLKRGGAQYTVLESFPLKQ